nr:26s proteasome non-atpase regulatory subunit 8 like a [Quercus suber]
MDPKLTEVSQLFERFKAAFLRNDFDTCTRLLSQLKVSLTQFRSLPPLFEATPNAIHELNLAIVSLTYTFWEYEYFLLLDH